MSGSAIATGGSGAYCACRPLAGARGCGGCSRSCSGFGFGLRVRGLRCGRGSAGGRRRRACPPTTRMPEAATGGTVRAATSSTTTPSARAASHTPQRVESAGAGAASGSDGRKQRSDGARFPDDSLSTSLARPSARAGTRTRARSACRTRSARRQAPRPPGSRTARRSAEQQRASRDLHRRPDRHEACEREDVGVPHADASVRHASGQGAPAGSCRESRRSRRPASPSASSGRSCRRRRARRTRSGSG